MNSLPLEIYDFSSKTQFNTVFYIHFQQTQILLNFFSLFLFFQASQTKNPSILFGADKGIEQIAMMQNEDEFTTFSKSINFQLKKLPNLYAAEAMAQIQAILSEHTLKSIQERNQNSLTKKFSTSIPLLSFDTNASQNALLPLQKLRSMNPKSDIHLSGKSTFGLYNFLFLILDFK